MDRLKTVAEWMTERGIGLEQLLEASGLDRKIFEAIRQGHYTPSPQQRQRLAAALGLTANDIAWGHGVPVEHIHGHGPQFGRSP
jgi:transcriptional regulator with XRE-family HTH domain